MNFGDRLKEARLKRGVTLQELGERIGKTEATIQRYESGNIKNLKSDIIEELAFVLRVSPAYLMGWLPEEPLGMTSEYNYYPVSVAAGLPELVEGVTEQQLEKISIPDSIMGKWAGSTDLFLMRVNGESMNRVIPHESLIAVKKFEVENLKDDDIVVFSDDYEYSVKRFYHDPENERVIFRPDSTDKRFLDHVVAYKDMKKLKIHGKVVVYVVVQN